MAFVRILNSSGNVLKVGIKPSWQRINSCAERFIKKQQLKDLSNAWEDYSKSILQSVTFDEFWKTVKQKASE